MAMKRPILTPRTRKILAGGLSVLLIAWLGFAAFIWHAMHESTDQFGHVMAHMPVAVFLILPFETMWTHARSGSLQIGDPAPDFLLTKVDHSGQVRLSEINAGHPVVLVFGSYT
jgi:hypothetical protein